jgi:hypothetical protein
MTIPASRRSRPETGRPGGYVSEFEQFMDDFIHRHPEVIESQREGWYQFWERDVDFEEWEEEAKDSVPNKKGYDYF